VISENVVCVNNSQEQINSLQFQLKMLQDENRRLQQQQQQQLAQKSSKTKEAESNSEFIYKNLLTDMVRYDFVLF
jgi:hypothetical protein